MEICAASCRERFLRRRSHDFQAFRSRRFIRRESKSDASWNGDVRGAVGALPTERRRLIEQLFLEGAYRNRSSQDDDYQQSTINRRKQAILNGLRMKLSDHNEFHNPLHKDSVRCNLNDEHDNQALRLLHLWRNADEAFADVKQ
jgi:hypothetical protein